MNDGCADTWGGENLTPPPASYCAAAARTYVAAEVDAFEAAHDLRRLKVLRAPITPDSEDVLAVCGLCGATVRPLDELIAFRLLVLHEGCAEAIASAVSRGRT